MAEDNKDLSRRFFEVMSSGNVDWFDEVISPNYVNHDPIFPEDVHGVEGVKETMSGYLDAFPDLKMTVQDQIAEGDKVFTRWVAE
jgi:ketosteroid isomerase-like protein